MKITVIGKGNMGRPLAALAKTAGHSVTIAGRGDSVASAAQNADVVVLAVPYGSALELSADATVRSALAGKIVIDITNPVAPDYMSLTIGHTTSAAEEIAKALSGARVVKAFNTLFAELLNRRVNEEKIAATVFVAADDEQVRKTVLRLAESFGFVAVDSGQLSNARYLEPAVELLIQLAFGKGHGTSIGLALVNAG